MAKKANSLAHTKWMCKYHIVFTPKYRRKVIYNQYKESIRDILKQLCSYKGVEILEGHLIVIRQIKCGLLPQIKNNFLRYAEALQSVLFATISAHCFM